MAAVLTGLLRRAGKNSALHSGDDFTDSVLSWVGWSRGDVVASEVDVVVGAGGCSSNLVSRCRQKRQRKPFGNVGRHIFRSATRQMHAKHHRVMPLQRCLITGKTEYLCPQRTRPIPPYQSVTISEAARPPLWPATTFSRSHQQTLLLSSFCPLTEIPMTLERGAFCAKATHGLDDKITSAGCPHFAAPCVDSAPVMVGSSRLC
jgi:hypothetical protein